MTFDLEPSPHSNLIDCSPLEGWYFAFLDGGLDCWAEGGPSGPYASEAEALAAARDAAGMCPHGLEDDEPCEACEPVGA